MSDGRWTREQEAQGLELRGLVLNPKQETFSFTCGAQVCPDRLTQRFPVVSAPRGNMQEEDPDYSSTFLCVFDEVNGTHQ